MLDTVFVPVHRAGWPFIGLFAAAAVGLSFVAWPLGVAGFVVTAWCVYFFRDPARVTPVREGLVVSAADGRVQAVDEAVPPAELEMGAEARPRVCVFMNVFDVHVNRVPSDGKVTRMSYRPGRFFNASLDKASEFNERHGLRLTLADGTDVACVQIAGLVARRILCTLSEGQAVRAGQRLGIIRFGSRVDVYLPKGVAPLVAVGQRAIAGETVIADMRAQEAARPGQVR
ncbi:MAG: phosphatidylserine decarboxylase [Rhodospirillales bacterium]|nr:phosphatidylserine decarboxylase [Rhodospirillales bacterium]